MNRSSLVARLLAISSAHPQPVIETHGKPQIEPCHFDILSFSYVDALRHKICDMIEALKYSYMEVFCYDTSSIQPSV